MEVAQLRNIPRDPNGTYAQNRRVEKLRIAFCEANRCDFARMFHQVAMCCPSLKHFKLLHERDFCRTFDPDEDEDAEDEVGEDTAHIGRGPATAVTI